MTDARDMVLPLVTVGGGDAMHDWYCPFSKLGLLRFDKAIATLVCINAFLVMWAFIALGVWMVWIMHTSRGS
ncbi:MAG: hypothetical protein V3U74_00925 [Thermodesulfobacteriota bacterium]